MWFHSLDWEDRQWSLRAWTELKLLIEGHSSIGMFRLHQQKCIVRRNTEGLRDVINPQLARTHHLQM
jgi:hypothetical protein